MTLPKANAFGRYRGAKGRRAARLIVALHRGRNAAVGDRCPYGKRAYVAAWLAGIGQVRRRLPPTWRPRIQAERARELFGRPVLVSRRPAGRE